LKNKIRGQFANLKKFRGQIIIFGKFEWSICHKFIGVKLKILENLRTKIQNLKDYNNEEFWNSQLLGVIWNSLNLTWTKYFINFHYFENSSSYYPNNWIHLKIFEFPQNITFPQNIPPSKHTPRALTFFLDFLTINFLNFFFVCFLTNA